MTYAGAQGGFAGLDQVNVRLSANPAGQVDVSVTLTIDGIAANPVSIQIR